MTVSVLRRSDADDATLLRRAARGDRRAHRIYCRRHAERAIELVEQLIGDGADSALTASRVLSETIAQGVAGDDALVRCAVRIVAPLTTERGLAHLVVALADGDGRTEDEVAALIDRTTAEVSELRALAYAEAGPTAAVMARECRGWPLVARKDRLTPAERQAADGHLALCRQCRARLDEQRQNRDKMWVRGGGAVSAVVVADVVSLSLPAGGAFAGSGLASVVLGKAGMAIVGAGAIAITATSAGVAVARSAPSQPHGTHVPSVGPRDPGGASGATTAPTSRSGNPRATTGQSGGGAATSTPTKKDPVTGKLLPSELPTAVPTISAPVQLPTALPTALPTVLPTKLPVPLATKLPLPKPTISVSVPPLQLPTGGSLLGP